MKEYKFKCDFNDIENIVKRLKDNKHIYTSVSLCEYDCSDYNVVFHGSTNASSENPYASYKSLVKAVQDFSEKHNFLLKDCLVTVYNYWCFTDVTIICSNKID